MSTAARFAPSKLPSIGFVVVALVHLGLVGFLVWGLTQPPLDRVWELSHALKIGKVATLAPEDHHLLQSALARHPRLAESLLAEGKAGLLSAHSRGWIETAAVTALVSANAPAPCRMRIEARPGERSSPIDVEVSGAGWQRQVALPAAGSTELTLPSKPKVTDIVEVRFSAKKARLDGAALGVHLGFRCGEKAGRE